MCSAAGFMTETDTCVTRYVTVSICSLRFHSSLYANVLHIGELLPASGQQCHVIGCRLRAVERGLFLHLEKTA